MNENYALIDNIETMISFTFRVEDTTRKSLNLESLMTAILKNQGMIHDFKKQGHNACINFDFSDAKGTSTTILFHFNPIRILRKELQHILGVPFTSGIRQDTNFIDVVKCQITENHQKKVITYACSNLLFIINACKTISTELKSFGLVPHIKLSLLKIEGVIDKVYPENQIETVHNMLLMNLAFSILPNYYKNKTVLIHSPDSNVLNQCHYLSINNVFADNAIDKNHPIQYEKVGQVYLKTKDLLRFEYSRNLQDKRYKARHSKERFTAILNTEDYNSIIERFRSYLQKHLNTTQNIYNESMLLVTPYIQTII